MKVQRVEHDEVAARAVGILGLDESVVDLSSTEAICASLRRAASFVCPASPRRIVDSVLDALTPLMPDLGRDEVNQALEALIDVGDLLELRPSRDRTRMLFLGPPSYVEKRPGHFLLLGIRPNAGPILGKESIGSEVIYESHTRSVVLDPDGAAEALATAGLHPLTREQWTKSPRQESPDLVVDHARGRLAAIRAPGPINGLTLIDSTKPVCYYKGRWRDPIPADRGLFVGRRPQAYGAPVWCAVEFADGVPQAVLDFPIDSTVAPGWDDARRLQAALDAERGGAQVFRVRMAGRRGGDYIFDFFGPLPSWAQRYLDLTGLPVAKSPAALFSYGVPGGAVRDVKEFLSKSLWMRVAEEVQET